MAGSSCGMDAKIFPDLVWQLLDRWVIVEVDEHSHTKGNYTPSCELQRVGNLVEAVHKVMGRVIPVLIIRFNPDAWDYGTASLTERVGVLADGLMELLNKDVSAYHPMVPHLWYLYYHSSAQPFIDAAKNASPRVLVYDLNEDDV